MLSFAEKMSFRSPPKTHRKKAGGRPGVDISLEHDEANFDILTRRIDIIPPVVRPKATTRN